MRDLTESIHELHQRFAPMDRGVPEPNYCRLTSRRGLCTAAELRFIDEHGCPVCHQPTHENSRVNNDQALFKRSLDAKQEHEASQPKAVEPPRIPLGPGVVGTGPWIAGIA